MKEFFLLCAALIMTRRLSAQSIFEPEDGNEDVIIDLSWFPSKDSARWMVRWIETDNE